MSWTRRRVRSEARLCECRRLAAPDTVGGSGTHLVDNAAGANVEVADLAVAHEAVRQADREAVGGQGGVLAAAGTSRGGTVREVRGAASAWRRSWPSHSIFPMATAAYLGLLGQLGHNRRLGICDGCPKEKSGQQAAERTRQRAASTASNEARPQHQVQEAAQNGRNVPLPSLGGARPQPSMQIKHARCTAAPLAMVDDVIGRSRKRKVTRWAGPVWHPIIGHTEGR